ncbi:hypothetical protein, partial [Acinetobacter sp. ANC 3813]|uniref:hypothetical protein n=1 Tax=Acinetobacter sp. ANC 3813 TaxID=1977873 RepID=UPI000B689982
SIFKTLDWFAAVESGLSQQTQSISFPLFPLVIYRYVAQLIQYRLGDTIDLSINKSHPSLPLNSIIELSE